MRTLGTSEPVTLSKMTLFTLVIQSRQSHAFVGLKSLKVVQLVSKFARAVTLVTDVPKHSIV